MINQNLKAINPLATHKASTESYNHIFEKDYTLLCRYALKYINEKSIAEDIVQDCFAYLWENWNRLSTIENLQYYMYKMVKNKSLNTLKNNYKLLRSINNEQEILLSEIDNCPSAQELMEQKDLEQILEQALQKLPNRCRTIFVLKRFDEMSNKDIAKLLNISVKTVENQMTIALKKLRISISEKCNIPLLVLLNLFFKKK